MKIFGSKYINHGLKITDNNSLNNVHKRWEKNDCKNTFLRPCAKASADPIAETHNRTELHTVVKGISELTFSTSKKHEGAILVK